MATTASTRPWWLTWTTVAPVVGIVVLAVGWGRTLSLPLVVVVALVLGAAVVSAVHHAEVVALRVGEPLGSLVLAVAVTVIEVGLILTLMLGGGEETNSLARDTVFAAVMITCNGVVGLTLLLGAVRTNLTLFNAEGTGAALATVATLATLTMVVPSFTTAVSGPIYSGSQLAFAAVVSLVVYAAFVATQTRRHRDFFLPISSAGEVITDEAHADPPSDRVALTSVGLLLVALVAVVGLAKIEQPAIKVGVDAAGLPLSFVGVVIALMVLMPETLAAANAARRDRIQTGLNLAYGSAIASIGLTIPVIAVASVIIDRQLVLGLSATEMVLLALTVAVSVLTVVPGRATRLQGSLHLVLFASFVFLASNP